MKVVMTLDEETLQLAYRRAMLGPLLLAALLVSQTFGTGTTRF